MTGVDDRVDDPVKRSKSGVDDMMTYSYIEVVEGE
jgi:hypothetical protein